jgi:hypothetical protein
MVRTGAHWCPGGANCATSTAQDRATHEEDTRESRFSRLTEHPLGRVARVPLFIQRRCRRQPWPGRALWRTIATSSHTSRPMLHLARRPYQSMPPPHTGRDDLPPKSLVSVRSPAGTRPPGTRPSDLPTFRPSDLPTFRHSDIPTFRHSDDRVIPQQHRVESP